MLCVDINVLVHAVNEGSDRHEEVRDWLGNALSSRTPLLVPDTVTTGFIRIVTSPRVMPSPLHPDQAFALVDWLLEHPSAMPLSGDGRARAVFRQLVQSLGLRGNDVPDAWIAALCIATTATIVTFDRGFRRFPGLQALEPGH